MNVKVVKFGGSSLADAAQFKKACDIIRADQGRRFVVDSAPGKRAGDDAKVTDLLYQCHREAEEGGDFRETLQKVKARFTEIAEGLQLTSVDLNAEFAEIEKQLEMVFENQNYATLFSLGKTLIASFFIGGFLLAFISTPICYFVVKNMVIQYRLNK